MDADVEAAIEHLTLMATSANTLLAEAAEKALADMVLKWTFNANQSRIGGRFASGTGGNQTTAHQQPGARVAKPKPVNPAAMPRAKVNPAMPVASSPAQAPATAHPAALPSGHAGAEARSRTPTTASTRGDETLTISHRSTAQTRQEAARQASHAHALSHQAAERAAAQRAAEKAELAAVRAKISGAKIPGYATTAQRDKAVSAMEKKYKIPHSMRGMSTAKRNAVAEMRSATRRLTTAKAEQARYQARVNAIKAAAKKGQTAKTQAYLAAQLAKAKATLATSKKKTARIQSEFNTAAKAWT